VRHRPSILSTSPARRTSASPLDSSSQPSFADTRLVPSSDPQVISHEPIIRDPSGHVIELGQSRSGRPPVGERPPARICCPAWSPSVRAER